MIYKYKDLIVWILLYLFGTSYLYSYGIKGDWQDLRKKKGLVSSDIKNPPGLGQKCVFGKINYTKECCKLFISTSFLSFIIMMSFYTGTSTKTFDNVIGFCNTFLSLLFVYFVFAGVPVDKQAFSDAEKAYSKFLSIISIIKSVFLTQIVDSEYERYQQMIKLKIREWHDKDDVKLGALILRIDSDFFNKMLPKDTEMSVQEMMRDYSYRILVLYKENNITLIDELINVFDKQMINYGAKVIDLAEFIINLESACVRMDKKQIDQKVEKHIEFKKSKEVKIKSISELEKALFQSFNIKNAEKA